MANQIQLTNTFNEFRQAYNGAADDITSLQGSIGSLPSDIAGANASIITITGLPVPATQTFVVTVVANPGSPPPNNIYQIDGVNNPVLNLVRGGVYTFDQSSATNVGHPIAFRTSANASFTTGVVSTGTIGVDAQTVFTVPDDAPADLRYYCTVHGNGMGNTIAVTGTGRGGILLTTNASIISLQNSISGANSNISAANSILSGITTDGTGALFSNTLQVATLNSGGSRVLLTETPGTGNGARVVDDDGFIYHSGNNSVELSGSISTESISTGNNATIGGTLDVTLTSQLDGNVTVGTNAAIIVAANGTFISPTGNVTLNTTDSRIDAFDIHAENRVDVSDDLEAWATAVDEGLSIHRIISVDDSDSASDHAVINRNNGVDAYAEFIAMNDVGNSDSGWISMGVNSTNYGAAQYAVTKNDDGYILYQPPEGTSANGDLVIGTGGYGTKNRILFSANGFDVPEDNTQMTITPGESVLIQINTESANSSTGALVVKGGIGLTGNLNVGGNVAITGTITLGGGGNTVSTSSLTIDNPIIFLGQNNAADTFDLGFVGEFNDGTEKYSGFVRDASDGGTYKLFSNTAILPANTVDFTDPNLVFSGVQVGDARIVNATVSSSNVTGALIVSGGVGVSGEIHTSGLIRATNQTVSTSTSTGVLVVSGGVGVAGNTHVGGDLIVSGGATFTGSVRVQELVEDLADIAPTTNQYTLNYNDGNIFYSTSAPAADFQVLVTNLPTDNGRAYNMTFVLPQGATGRRPAANVININSTNTVINYVGGNTSFTPTNSKTDIFSFTIFRRGGAFTVAGVVTANTVL